MGRTRMFGSLQLCLVLMRALIKVREGVFQKYALLFNLSTCSNREMQR